MLTYSGLSYVRVRIEGEECPDSVVLEVVTVRSDLSLALPSFSLSLRDTGDFLHDRVVEGARVEILLAQRKENDAQWMPFRIFSYSPSQAPRAGTTYRLHGYYDYKTYLYSRVVRSFAGTSSSVVETLAGEGGLQTYLDTTTEADTGWYCARRTLAQFVRESVVPAATAGPESLMMSVVDARTGTWCYKDVARVARLPPESKLINSSAVNAGEYDAMILEHRYGNESGYHNALGYSMKNVRYDAARDETVDDNEVSVAKAYPQLSMNRDVPPDSHVLYAPLDFGNNGLGPQYRGQHLRQLSLWSMRMSVLIGAYTPFPLLTVHQLDLIGGNAAADARQSGKYVCVGRIVAATPHNYREALTFIRNSESVNNSGVIS